MGTGVAPAGGSGDSGNTAGRNLRDASFEVLEPEKNCWQVQVATRAALLSNSEYFLQLADSLKHAARLVLIAGWKLDSELILDPQGNAPENQRVLRFLASLAIARPALKIRIMLWNRTILYGGNKKIPRKLAALRSAHPQIDFRIVRARLGASHHQKLVCIDDNIAFVGGIDLCAGRWDRIDHPPFHPRRTLPEGESYGPIHDLQMLIEGRAACTVATYARAQWMRAAGEELRPAEPVSNTAWPESGKPDFLNVSVAIARTDPTDPHGALREVEALNRAAFERARRSIYIESQYLTSEAAGEALIERLKDPDGPEIVVITTRTSRGLMERVAMGVNRDRLLRRLYTADRYGRLRVYYPVGRIQQETAEVKVHAKLVVIDDVFLRVGSSNLNNRSMGPDTECDLGVEGVDEASRSSIANVRDRLLAEQLHRPIDDIRAARGRKESLIAVIDELNAGHLQALVPRKLNGPTSPLPFTALFDPKEPLSPGYLWRSIGGRRARSADQFRN